MDPFQQRVLATGLVSGATCLLMQYLACPLGLLMSVCASCLSYLWLTFSLISLSVAWFGSLRHFSLVINKQDMHVSSLPLILGLAFGLVTVFEVDHLSMLTIIIMVFIMHPVGPMVQCLNHKCRHFVPPCRMVLCQGLKVFQLRTMAVHE